MTVNGTSSLAASLFSLSMNPSSSPTSAGLAIPATSSASEAPTTTTYDNGNLNFNQFAQDIQSAQSTLATDGTSGSTAGLAAAHHTLRVDIHSILNQMSQAPKSWDGDTQLWQSLKGLIATQHQVISAMGSADPSTSASPSGAAEAGASAASLAAVPPGTLLDIPA
jgi:hypothetical protein